MTRWSDLCPGDSICVRRNDTTVTQGKVDLVSGDGSVLWIHTGAGAGRMLFLKEDGFSVHKLGYAPINTLITQGRIKPH
jgi:hypothetical protein